MTITAEEVMTPIPAARSTTRRHQVVVAGVDSNPPAMAAARWAADEARRPALGVAERIGVRPDHPG